MIWYYISLLLCSVGFLKEIRPSEPFVTDYMQEPYRNVTENEVKFFLISSLKIDNTFFLHINCIFQLIRYVYPIATYANLILSVVILLVTDLLR